MNDTAEGIFGRWETHEKCGKCKQFDARVKREEIRMYLSHGETH